MSHMQPFLVDVNKQCMRNSNEIKNISVSVINLFLLLVIINFAKLDF